MKLNKKGDNLIPENEYEMIWIAIWDWNYLEQIKLFNRFYDEYMDGDLKDQNNPIIRKI